MLVINSAPIFVIFRKCDTANTNNVHLYVVNKCVNSYPEYIADSFTTVSQHVCFSYNFKTITTEQK